jgi:hypothetical protein
MFAQGEIICRKGTNGIFNRHHSVSARNCFIYDARDDVQKNNDSKLKENVKNGIKHKNQRHRSAQNLIWDLRH